MGDSKKKPRNKLEKSMDKIGKSIGQNGDELDNSSSPTGKPERAGGK